jgi:hypothetical protein
MPAIRADVGLRHEQVAMQVAEGDWYAATAALDRPRRFTSPSLREPSAERQALAGSAEVLVERFGGEGIEIRAEVRCTSAGHDLEAEIEVDQHVSE